MPSSTSSSDKTSTSDRSIPQGNWGRALIVGLVLTLVVIGAWEVRVRSEGYAATLDDTSDLWAAQRTEVRKHPDRTAVIGSSRILFDLDLDIYAEVMGEAPIQLALPGSKPLDVFENLVADENFKGNVIVGVVPGLYFAPQGFPIDRTLLTLRRYENWSPAQQVGHQVGNLLNRSLAFINNEDLTLENLLERARLADRPGTRGNIMPELPPYFGWVDGRRETRMWDQCDFGTPLAERIQQVWLPLFTPPPPPPHLTQEEFMALFMESVERDLERTRVAVETVRARGGKVVFVRCPSSGGVRELERKFSPREGFYDRILAVTGAPGIHFEDYPELNLDCPEWSHLTAADSERFTTALMPLLADALNPTQR